jgi:hypothetical protein
VKARLAATRTLAPKKMLGAAPVMEGVTPNGNNLREYVRPFNRKAASVYTKEFNFLSPKAAEAELMYNYHNEEGEGYGYDEDNNFVEFKKTAVETFRKSIFKVQSGQSGVQKSPSSEKVGSVGIHSSVRLLLPGPAYATDVPVTSAYQPVQNRLSVILENPNSNSGSEGVLVLAGMCELSCFRSESSPNHLGNGTKPPPPLSPRGGRVLQDLKSGGSVESCLSFFYFVV